MDEIVNEMTSLALSIRDQENRDLILEKVVIALARAGEWDKAQEMAGYMKEPYEKAEGLNEIASQLISQANFEQSLIILHEAELIATQASEPWRQAELLSRIAQSLLLAKAPDKADKVWERAISIAQIGESSVDLQGSVDCSSVLAEIAEALALGGNTGKALEVAKAIKSPGKRDRAITAVKKVMDQEDQGSSQC